MSNLNSKSIRVIRMYSKVCPKKEKWNCDAKCPRKPKTLSEFCDYPGKVKKTEGGSYIVQQTHSSKVCDYNLNLKRIQATVQTKDKQFDPMPAFTSVGERLIDLCRFGLHPNYRLYQTIPRRCAFKKSADCDCMGDPLPKHLLGIKDLMEKKNMRWELKMLEPPNQIAYEMEDMTKEGRNMLEMIIIRNAQKHVNNK